jgi:hypothetical protein
MTETLEQTAERVAREVGAIHDPTPILTALQAVKQCYEDRLARSMWISEKLLDLVKPGRKRTKGLPPCPPDLA